MNTFDTRSKKNESNEKMYGKICMVGDKEEEIQIAQQKSPSLSYSILPPAYIVKTMISGGDFETIYRGAGN